MVFLFFRNQRYHHFQNSSVFFQSRTHQHQTCVCLKIYFLNNCFLTLQTPLWIYQCYFRIFFLLKDVLQICICRLAACRCCRAYGLYCSACVAYCMANCANISICMVIFWNSSPEGSKLESAIEASIIRLFIIIGSA